ncbi:MAG TPA: hypothetical protein ENF42_02845 [Candidatus Bathyarchaeota archaeon]|nr:hypothetical protein [Candidatus Bathyarchaeota archaeon]
MDNLTIEHCLKFPFSQKARKLISLKIRSVEDLAKPQLSPAILLAEKKIMSAIKPSIKPESPGPWLEILSYPIANIILSIINVRSLTYRYAVREAEKIASRWSADDLKTLVEIGKEEFGIEAIIIGRDIKSVVIDLVSYIKLASCLGVGPISERWDPSNKKIMDGYVHVTIREYMRLLEAKVKNHILEAASRPPASVPANILEVAGRIKNAYLRGVKRRVEPRIGTDPPCMRWLMKEVDKGLTHVSRFILATYLLNRGNTIKETLEVFKQSPDYDEKISTYQISYIKRKGYLPPSCARLEELGICKKDETCGDIRNPLQYGRKR